MKRLSALLMCASFVGLLLSLSLVACADGSPSSVEGSPSLSVSFIDEVLAHYGSPAVGLGATLYADSRSTGIDDVYALAFFMHESSFGLRGVAQHTHSLGNIICAGYPTCFGRFRSYAKWAYGATDWYWLIAHEYIAHGLTTVEQIIPVYAPSGENNVSAYIQAVNTSVASFRSGSLEVQA